MNFKNELNNVRHGLVVFNSVLEAGLDNSLRCYLDTFSLLIRVLHIV